MHCNNGLNNKLVVSLVENKVAEETGDLKYLQDSMYEFIKTLKEIILGEYSPKFFNEYVDEALKLHGSNLEEFLKIPKMGLELKEALDSIDDAIDISNQEFRDNLVLLLDSFQTTLDNMEYEARSPYTIAVKYGFVGTEEEWLDQILNDTELLNNLRNGATDLATYIDTIPRVVSEAVSNTVISSGFVTIDSFELGATITQRNQALRHAADGKLYRWAGDLPKVVPESSTPASTGGSGDNSWLEVSDTSLRQEIASARGSSIVGNTVIKFDTVAELKAATWLTAGTVVETKGYYVVGDAGAATYKIVSTTDYEGTPDELGEFTLTDDLVIKLSTGPVNALQFGAQDDVESGANIQAMFNWCAKEGNSKTCVLGSNGENFRITKMLVMSHRHNGLNFTCDSAWLKISEGFRGTSALCMQMGVYGDTYTYFTGDELGKSIEDITIPKLNVNSDFNVGELAIQMLDDPALLPENGGTATEAYAKYSEWQDSFTGSRMSANGFGASYRGGESPDLNVDMLKNITIGQCNFIDTGRSGLAVSAKCENFKVDTITAYGCVYHPLATSIGSEFTENPNYTVDVTVNNLYVDNCGTIFDFSSSTKQGVTTHGTIKIGRAVGRRIRSRTKVHGSYERIEIGLLDSQRQYGGKPIGTYAALNFLESKSLHVGTLIERSACYSAYDTGLYASSSYVNGVTINIDNMILDIPDIVGAAAPGIIRNAVTGMTKAIADTMRILIGRIDYKGPFPRVLPGDSSYFEVQSINIDSKGSVQPLLEVSLFVLTAETTKIGSLNVMFDGFNTANAPLFSSTFNSDGFFTNPSLNIGEINLSGYTPQSAYGVIYNCRGISQDTYIGSIKMPAGHTFYSLSRIFDEVDTRCGIVLIRDKSILAEMSRETTSTQTIIGDYQYIPQSIKPCLVWRDPTTNELLYNENRPANSSDGLPLIEPEEPEPPVE